MRHRSKRIELPGLRERIQSLSDFGFTAKDIGRVMGRHHTTVLYHLGSLKPKGNQRRRKLLGGVAQWVVHRGAGL